MKFHKNCPSPNIRQYLWNTLRNFSQVISIFFLLHFHHTYHNFGAILGYQTYNIEIINYIDLNDSLFINYIDNNDLDKESKTSISIASAVTAYSRSYMYSVIKNNIDNIYYTDTDSLYLDHPLDENLVDPKELGKFKLEYIFKDSIYLGPKIYAGITQNNDYICKIKGFKDKVPFEDLKNLLIKDNKLSLSHVKWFRSLINGNITLKDQIYELQKTENKRLIIYNNDNLAISTKPYSIK